MHKKAKTQDENFLCFCFLLIFILPVHLRGDALKLFEDADVVTGVRIAELGSYLRNGLITVSEQFFGMVYLISVYITYEVFTHISRESAGEMAFAYAAQHGH